MAGETQGGFLISQIKQLQGRIFERLLTEAGISEFNGAQGRILYVLWLEDSLPIVELSRRTGLAKTTLTSMLDRMVQQGYLERNTDEKDRRQFKISLTMKAKGMKEKYRMVSAQMSEIFYRHIPPDEIHTFEGTLKKILNNLEDKENER